MPPIITTTVHNTFRMHGLTTYNFDKPLVNTTQSLWSSSHKCTIPEHWLVHGTKLLTWAKPKVMGHTTDCTGRILMWIDQSVPQAGKGDYSLTEIIIGITKLHSAIP